MICLNFIKIVFPIIHTATTHHDNSVESMGQSGTYLQQEDRGSSLKVSGSSPHSSMSHCPCTVHTGVWPSAVINRGECPVTCSGDSNHDCFPWQRWHFTATKGNRSWIFEVNDLKVLKWVKEKLYRFLRCCIHMHWSCTVKKPTRNKHFLDHKTQLS